MQLNVQFHNYSKDQKMFLLKLFIENKGDEKKCFER